MYDQGFFSGIFFTVIVFLLAKCSAQEENENLVYVPDDYFRHETPLRCYDCNSEYDQMCGDPFNPYSIGVVNCSEQRPPEHLIDPEKHPNERLKPTVCRKIVQKVEGRKRVIRECGYIQDTRDDKDCVRRSGTKNVEIFYCACTTSLCNQANVIRSSLFNLGVVVSIVLPLGLTVAVCS